MKKVILLLAMTWGISVCAAVRGDVNGDNAVDVSDANSVFDKILGKGSSGNTDVNGDNETDVSDVNIIVNIILGKDDAGDGHEYVDLGLPGGVLWATCNIGADKPEESGKYFAWGETDGYAKDEPHAFGWSSYKWMTPGKSGQQYVTKYTVPDGQSRSCWYSSGKYVGTTVDGVTYMDLSVLLPEDDAATVNWGSDWRMPTYKELMDLCNTNYTTSEWVTENGVAGRRFTSRSNGNSIFIPASGYHDGSGAKYEGSQCCYWSCSLYIGNSCYAHSLDLDSGFIGTMYYSRYSGFSVRPVRVATSK